MRMQGRVLHEEEILRIHGDSIRILEEIGVRFPSIEALALLESKGARVNWDRQIAYISKEMVDCALSDCPKQFVMGARNPEMNLELPSSCSVFNMDGCGVNTLDFSTGARRPSVLRDVEDSAKIFEELDICNIFWVPVSPGDIPYGARSIAATGASFLNTSKHVMDEVKTKAEVPYVIEMCKCMVGDEEQVKSGKIYSATYCTVAPLCHDKDMLEATMDLTRFMAPILVYPMPACGTTGPASLYSNIALANAEALSSIVLFQLVSPGVPILYGAALGVVNVRSGMFLEGAVETALQMTALGEIGKFYGLPVMNAGCLTDAKVPGMQAAMEKVLTTLPLVLCEIDVIQGIGLLESSMTLSFEQMMIDYEIAHLCRRMKEGVIVSDELDFYEDIKTVGQGGHFLKQKNTRAAFRAGQFYQAELSDRNSYDSWVDLGKPEMIDHARRKIQSILETERKNPLPEHTEKQLTEIVEEAKRKLSE